jgi:dipeptidyl aminopeptidase/acylaminoacyl peptidase
MGENDSLASCATSARIAMLPLSRWVLLLLACSAGGLHAAAPPGRPPGWPLPPAARARLRTEAAPGAGAISALAVSPDGKTVAAARAGSGTVWIWEVETGRILHRLLPGARALVACLAFDPEGKVLAVGARAQERGMVLLFDAVTGKKRLAVQAHPGCTNALDFSPGGKTLATGGDEASLRVWDARTGKPLHAMRSDNMSHHAVSFSPDGKLLAAGGEGNDLTLWDPATGEVVRDCHGRPGTVRFAAFTPDGRHVLWAARESTIRIHDTATAEVVALYGSDRTSFNAFALSPDGRLLATADKEGAVRLWDRQSSLQLQVLQAHTGEATALAFSSRSNALASGGQEGSVVVWGLSGLTRSRWELLWLLLGSDQPAEVELAERALRRAETLPFLRERLERFARASGDLPGLIADLDADTFLVRQRASEELERRGPAARAALVRVLASRPSLEVSRRAERILRHLRDSVDEERCALGALRVVEEHGTAEARKLVERLAGVRVETPLVRQARTALRRMGARK